MNVQASRIKRFCAFIPIHILIIIDGYRKKVAAPGENLSPAPFIQMPILISWQIFH